MFDKDLFGDDCPPDRQGSILAESWEYPPFSVLNMREGWWQERKRHWLSLGIKSEVGRDADSYSCNGDAVAKYDYLPKIDTGTSVFDPVVCELAYRWFSAPGHQILDPFAGGSVRGIVASTLGRRYFGCELRAEQVAANNGQMDICNDPLPTWHCGDSTNIRAYFDGAADFIFSCPPYADLEVYSDDPADISNMEYDEFITAYRSIIRASVDCLNEDSFACFVVGEVRDKKGNYRNFVGDTVEAFRDAGCEYYNEAILITSVGSLPVRVGRQFKAGRKLGKTHQNVLVFVKGDGKRATRRMEDLA